MVRLSDQYRYWGYRKIYDLMKGKGIAVSRERVRLIRRREGLQVVTKAQETTAIGANDAVGSPCLLSEPCLELRFRV